MTTVHVREWQFGFQGEVRAEGQGVSCGAVRVFSSQELHVEFRGGVCCDVRGAKRIRRGGFDLKGRFEFEGTTAANLQIYQKIRKLP